MPGDHDHARRLPHVGLDSEHALADGESAYGANSTRAEQAAKSEAIRRHFERLMVRSASEPTSPGFLGGKRPPIRVQAETCEAIREIEE
jgi:hypothetical protein